MSQSYQIAKNRYFQGYRIDILHPKTPKMYHIK